MSTGAWPVRSMTPHPRLSKMQNQTKPENITSGTIMSGEPKTYIHGHSAAVLKAHARRTAQRDAAYLLPHLKPDFHVLDVGCGPGTISADLAGLVPQGKVTCLEISETALDAARGTMRTRGVENVDYASGDVTGHLPFADDTFDVVHSHQVLIHIPDAAVAMKEMRRVLKPGGVMAARDMIVSTCTWYPAQPALRGWETAIVGTIGATGADPDMGARLRATALRAGFVDERIVSTASCWTFATPEEVQFWGGSTADRMGPESELTKKVVEGSFMTKDEVGDYVTAAREWMTVEGAWFGAMNGEILCWK